MNDNNEQILPRKEAENTSTKTLPEKEQIVSLPSYSKSYSETQLESTKFHYIWKINRFNCFLGVRNTLISAPFPETAQCNIRMDVDGIYPKRIIRFYVCTKREFLGLCNVFSYAFDPNLSQTCTFNKDNVFFNNKSSGTLVYKLNTESLYQYLSKDILELTFKFEIFDTIRINTIYGNVTPPSAIFAEDQTSENSILHDSKSDDIKSIKIIITNEKSYTVSKDLLDATNSAYFKTLCNTKKEINMSDQLKANDELEAFEDMLLFIITGKKPSGLCDESTSISLLNVAHKYDVRDLKYICEKHLVDCITLKNAVEMIQLAFSCDAKFLKKHALSFIKFYMEKIAVTKEFQSLPQEYFEKIMKLIEINKTYELCDTESVMSSPLFSFIRD